MFSFMERIYYECFPRGASLAIIGLSFAVLAAIPAHAGGTAIKLYNTGVNNDGTVAATNSVDLHYTQVNPTGNPSAYVNYYGAWATPTNSLYVSPDQNNGATYKGSIYTVNYQTTFDLTGLAPAITGAWSTDNLGLDILINGHSTGLTSPGFGAFTPFDLSPFQSDFQAGVNTLDFVWKNQNQGSPGGLDIQNLQGTALPAAVPEASTTVSFSILLALGMGGVMVAARRKKA